MKIVILTGGFSDEREISLISAKNVAGTLRKAGYDVEIFDLKRGLGNIKINKKSIVFPIVHGKEGEGGELQEKLEKLKINFIGFGSKACKQGWDKIAFKKFCERQKIITPKWQLIEKRDYRKINLKMPFVIKPSDNGSSIDVFLIKTKKDLSKIPFEELFKKYEKLLVEEFIEGVEATVAILGDKVLPVLEIIPPKREMFNYKNKYNGRTKEIPFAPSLKKDTQRKLQKISLIIQQKLKGKDISRIDFIVKNSIPYVLELNTIPGLTPESLFPKAAKAAGLDFEKMLIKLVNSGKKRRKRRNLSG